MATRFTATTASPFKTAQLGPPPRRSRTNFISNVFLLAEGWSAGRADAQQREEGLSVGRAEQDAEPSLVARRTACRGPGGRTGCHFHR